MGSDAESISQPKRRDNESSSANPTPLSNTPTSFRLATGDQLLKEGSIAKEHGENSTYGVQSLQDATRETSPDMSDQRHPVDYDGPGSKSDVVEGHSMLSTLKPQAKSRQSSVVSQDTSQEPSAETGNSSPSHPHLQLHTSSLAPSLTSLSLDSQAPLSSLASSPKTDSSRSLRPSDEDLDEGGSQAIASSSEDEALRVADLQDSAPQLIMPSIKMPSRRPFTDRGLAMGRLKILLAGNSGVGKTSLIKSIVQTCADVVHVDSLPNGSSFDSPASTRTKRMRSLDQSYHQPITEIYASTKPYPHWWANAQKSSLFQRKSMGDTVLERNLCFVDTPGYSAGMSKLATMNEVTEFVEDQLQRSFSAKSGEGDVVSLLSGHGGSLVDVVFYLISQDLTNEDTVFLQRLAALTNVVILISKSDNLSLEEIEVLRRSISKRIQDKHIKTFVFPSEHIQQGPFTVCSTPTEDDDNMDASLLMSSEYVEPLIPSELGILMEQMLSKDVVACLRHHAATKLMQRRGSFSAPETPKSIVRAASNPIYASLDTSHGAESRLSPYMQAQITDYTQHEGQLGRLRLAKWAADLQRSLQDERAKYEALAKGERTVWLNERLDDLDKNADSMDRKGQERRRGHKRSGSVYKYGLANSHDPLGLLRLDEFIRERGWLALRIAGGFGILGAVAVWCAKTCVGNGERNWAWVRDEP
ncbi:uncharacterized protein KY384_008230 [Bacidia gigantensis]|uniref:uncharacterized protein n=1 Tax=Bacidia gigantensis TaxID=2732470 RepID=UPI001D0454D1|nr:uncharacterized protein KY384_008230 [Bacidia gigantensis]KAG8526801.1 hypothetical protein KY384_008230 [Bacidia gigantensis]